MEIVTLHHQGAKNTKKNEKKDVVKLQERTKTFSVLCLFSCLS